MFAHLLAVAALAFAPHGCHPLVADAAWSGPRLIVTPSRCGRRVARRDPQRVLQAAVRAGGQGAPNRRSLLRQLECHAVFAPLKPTWDLEDYRPAVSWLRMILTACNPPALG